MMNGGYESKLEGNSIVPFPISRREVPLYRAVQVAGSGIVGTMIYHGEFGIQYQTVARLTGGVTINQGRRLSWSRCEKCRCEIDDRLSPLAQRFLWNETVIIAAGFAAETRVSKKSLAATMARGGEDHMRMMSIIGELGGHCGTIEDTVSQARQLLGHYAVW